MISFVKTFCFSNFGNLWCVSFWNESLPINFNLNDSLIWKEEWIASRILNIYKSLKEKLPIPNICIWKETWKILLVEENYFSKSCLPGSFDRPWVIVLLVNNLIAIFDTLLIHCHIFQSSWQKLSLDSWSRIFDFETITSYSLEHLTKSIMPSNF